MAFQSPLIAIPRKTTQDVDWTNPIRSIIAHSYGEDPKNYVEECSNLQRCRQDAVRGAGSDQTARDLLYKYFGQLELLELRFAEIKVPFIWNDAFTDKPTTQTSLAFEKASIIHLISSVLSALAQTPSRSDPEGLKRAYYNTRASAGMLTYINENFLHAPSTDLSREVVQLCIGIMTAQATEIFTEKLIEEKKSPALISRSANSTAGMYNTALEEMKEFQGKGIFDRNWLYVLQIKAKLFSSLTQYYKGVADNAAGKHGISLVRFKLADNLAKEASQQAQSFNYGFISSSTPSLPHDAATSLVEITKSHQTICQELKEQSVKDNDLIYHEVLPSEASLPAIEKLPPTNPITIQEIYGNPEITKLIGPDIFIKLIPLAVHESASIYSEEKAKLVRNEVERVELSQGELNAGLDHLGLPAVVNQWKNIVDDEDTNNIDVEISSQVRRLAEDISRGGNVESSLRQLDTERERCERDLRELSGQLDNESRECERMRAKYTPQFTQAPSGPQTANLRSNIASNLSALSSAGQSDSHLQTIWREISPQISLLLSGESGLESVAAQVAAGKASAPINQGISLLDLQEEVGSTSGLADAEKEELKKAISEASERLDRLGKIRRERDEVLKDLKEKVQNDDVSNLLLLNRRSTGVEPQLFAAELEKFRPYQSRLAAAIQASTSILTELEMLVRQVEKGKGVKELQRSHKDRSKRVRAWERKLIEAGEGWAEIQAGLSKGLTYYDSLDRALDELKREVNRFVKSRESERNRSVGEIETRQRIGGSPPPQGSGGARSLEERLAALSVDRSSSGYSQPSQKPSTPSFPPPPSQISTPSAFPPPPPAKPSNPYDFSSLSSNVPSAFSTAASPPPPPQPQTQRDYGSSSYVYNSPQQANPYSPPAQHQSSPYPPPPPPSQPPRPAQTSYGSYESGPQSSYRSNNSQPNYPSPPTQSHYSSPPPQPQPHPSYSSHPPPAPQSSYPSHPPPSQPSYPSYAPPSQPQSQQAYYPPPPSQRPAYSSPSPQQPQQYPNFPPPTGQYQAPSQPNPAGRYGGYQPPPQGGYQYR
ncbi:uncharacterized protein I303_106144 [Kwoniella dejecticola CBS 10117]|uniref:BRO domain-containing protein 1 n=1 Tax=Kwoniella dejecticola CBS 10117 TaxID=1296121 RepID=A0A1A6A1E3_9TREE|nr:vacuolar protein-sorting protein BRO1 [Kwoniella dejecticola CBS 10117]OBR83879.1 vacuolar protein-sorting protein BRO1 [Kwoniella dejecticola CBS 10117]